MAKSPRPPQLVTLPSGNKPAVGTVALLLLLIGAIELSTNQSFYNVVTGKTALTVQGNTLLSSLSTAGKQVGAWIFFALADLVVAAYVPPLAVGSTVAIFLLVLLSHEQTIAGYVTGLQKLLGQPVTCSSSWQNTPISGVPGSGPPGSQNASLLPPDIWQSIYGGKKKVSGTQ